MKAEPRRLARALALTALVMLAAPVVFAQTAETPSPTPTPQLSKVGLTVRDNKGRAVEDLAREDVRLFEDGAERPVGSFEKEQTPLSYGLVVDNSGSLRSQINYAVASAKFMAASNRPGDETFVLRFVSSDRIQMLQDMTGDADAVQRALDQMYIEGGQTALFDALYLAADYLVKNSKASDGPVRRRALVLVSDGEDRRSSYKLEEVLKLLRDGDIQVFCIGLIGALDRQDGFTMKSKREKAEATLKRLADETGGRAFFPARVNELREAAEEIVGEFRAQYVVGYAPAKPSGKLEVKLAESKGKEKRKAFVRTGKAAAGPDTSNEKKKGGQ